MSKTKDLAKLTEAYRDALLVSERYKLEYKKLFNYTETMMHSPESELAVEGRKYVQSIIDERDRLKAKQKENAEQAV
jgi:hypothetical protein